MRTLIWYSLLGVALVLDVVADHRAADGAGHRGSGAAAAGANLVAEQAADQAAGDGAGAGAAARLHHLDRFDGAVAGGLVVDIADLARLRCCWRSRSVWPCRQTRRRQA
jgi:hypothetical protein